MNCLYCGFCCTKPNPFNDTICPYLIEDDSFIFCNSYKIRPRACRDHKFNLEYCPIGMDRLKLKRSDKITERINEGYERIKNINSERRG
jgi:Fe-S-cluster containining protein